MEFGAHLPLAILDGSRAPTAADLGRYAATAEAGGFTFICANDHLVFTVPWLDSLTALAAVVPATRSATLMTSVALPVPRGPVPLAKALWTLQIISEGRLAAGLGPGSHPADHEAVGLAFDERWPRFEAAARAVSLLLGRPAPRPSRFYEVSDPIPTLGLRPPPVWIGSWGSEAGLRRVARLGDGWLASIYNTDPRAFSDARQRLHAVLSAAGRDQEALPNALATGFSYLSESRSDTEGALELVARMLRRPLDALRDKLLIGSVNEVIEQLEGFRAVGAERVFIWPVRDEIKQLETFGQLVLPLLR